jgi:hypothetical protein
MRTPLVRAWLALIAVLLLVAAPAEAKLDDRSFSQAKKDLEQALAGGDADAVVKAVEAIAADGTRRAAEAIIAAGASDRLDSPKAYEAVLGALAGMCGGEAREWLVDSLEKKTEPKQWMMRCILCDALATVSGDDVAKAIASRLKDSVPYVISSAAKALGKRKDKAGVDPLIKALADLEKKKDVAWIDVKAALTAICGFDFDTASEWEAFWASKKETFDPAKDRGEKTTSSTEVRGEARFFTEVIVSKRVMFVIDVSGSMREQDIPVSEGGSNDRAEKTYETRIDVVKKALIACIKDLKSDVKFNVIAFSDGARSWRPSRQGLQPASGANKEDAIKWVSALNAHGATETDVALEEAFANVDVNTIVLLSDGQPTRGRGGQGGGPGGGGQGGGPGGGGQGGGPMGGGRGRGGMGEIDIQEILDKVKVLNRIRGVKIHTFCFKVFEDMMNGGGQGGGRGGRGGRGMDYERCLDFLRRLAEENGGKLTLV